MADETKEKLRALLKTELQGVVEALGFKDTTAINHFVLTAMQYGLCAYNDSGRATNFPIQVLRKHAHNYMIGRRLIDSTEALQTIITPDAVEKINAFQQLQSTDTHQDNEEAQRLSKTLMGYLYHVAARKTLDFLGIAYEKSVSAQAL